MSSSLDDLAAGIAVAVSHAEQTASAAAGAVDTAGQVSHRLAGLGADGAAQNVNAIVEKLGVAKQHLAAFIDACNEATQMTEAAKIRGGLLTSAAKSTTSLPRSGNHTSAQSPQSPTPRPTGVPATWSHRQADSGNGHVWQQPNASGNADMVRVMAASQRYPHGYVRYYNSNGQPIGVNGKPGTRAETHIPINADGTHQTPQGWNHD